MSTFKIAYNETTDTLFTDVSFMMACDWISDALKAARAAVKAGEFEDVAGAMACRPIDLLPVHFHNGTPESMATVDTYAAVLACLVGGSLEDVRSGGYVSWFWFDGPGSELLKCRSGNGIAKKLG